MTTPTLNLLAVFLTNPGGRHYGLELAKATGLLTGSVYPILARLESAGWLRSDWEDIDPHREGRRARRYYELTPVGARHAEHAVQEARRRLEPPIELNPAPEITG